jgi:ABC-type antimicrobial peptide transport system permease subunit
VDHSAGVLAGIGTALAANSAFRGWLLLVSPLAPSIYLIVGLLQTAVTLVACAMPALHAARVDALSVLRSE